MKKPGHGDAPEFEETPEGQCTQYGMAAGCCGARVRASPSGRKVERAPGRQAVMRWQVENAGRYWTGTQFTPPPERLLPRGKVARIATSPAWPNPLGVKLGGWGNAHAIPLTYTRKLLRGGTVVPAIRAVALAFKRIKGSHQGFQRGGTRVPLRPFHADKRR